MPFLAVKNVLAGFADETHYTPLRSYRYSQVGQHTTDRLSVLLSQVDLPAVPVSVHSHDSVPCHPWRRV